MAAFAAAGLTAAASSNRESFDIAVVGRGCQLAILVLLLLLAVFIQVTAALSQLAVVFLLLVMWRKVVLIARLVPRMRKGKIK